jgi:hypothetical protein
MAQDKIDKANTPSASTPGASATPRKVRGLLEVVEAEANDEAWELESLSAEFVPGMGLGATKQATRWAWLGMQQEIAGAVERAMKRPAHRPKKHHYETKDAYRAFAAWQMCSGLRKTIGQPDAKMTTRELIRLIVLVEDRMGLNAHQKLFTGDYKTSEQSVSRGKAHLDIDANWKSKVCEELWRTFQQTT